MKHFCLFITFFILSVLSGCVSQGKNSQRNNAELEKLVARDQEMRATDTDEPMEPTDKIHRKRIMEMLTAGDIKTVEDKFNAALILQHTALTYCNGELQSISPENYFLAYSLARSAFELGYSDAAYMTAATYDRYMLYTEGFQKYGTQKIYDEKTDKMLWAPIDTTTTDQERAIYKVKPLKELLKEAKMKPFK
jgi:hypothetical protein